MDCLFHIPTPLFSTIATQLWISQECNFVIFIALLSHKINRLILGWNYKLQMKTPLELITTQQQQSNDNTHNINYSSYT